MIKLTLLISILPIIFAASPMHSCQQRWSNRALPTAIFFGGRENFCRQEPCSVFQSIGWGTTIIDFTPNREITGEKIIEKIIDNKN